MNEKEQEEKELLEYINGSLDFQGVLWDLDLMPEQLQRGSRDWSRMMTLAFYHRDWMKNKP